MLDLILHKKIQFLDFMGGSNAFLLKLFNLHMFYFNKFGMLYVCDGYMVCYINNYSKVVSISCSPPNF